MVNLRYRDNESMAGDHRGTSYNGSGQLKYLAVEDDAGIPPWSIGSEDGRAHGTAGGADGGLLLLDGKHPQRSPARLISRMKECFGHDQRA